MKKHIRMGLVALPQALTWHSCLQLQLVINQYCTFRDTFIITYYVNAFIPIPEQGFMLLNELCWYRLINAAVCLQS